MGEESGANALIRWAITGEDKALKSLDRVDKKAGSIAGKNTLRSVEDRLNRLTRVFGMVGARWGRTIGGIVGKEQAFARLGARIGHTAARLSFLARGLLSVVTIAPAVISAVANIAGTLLKLGLAIKGIGLGAMVVLLRQVIKANDEFRGSFAQISASFNPEQADEIIQYIEKRARTLPASFDEIFHNIATMMTTQLKDQIYKEGKLDEDLLDKMIMLPMRAAVRRPRTAGFIPQIIADIMKGGPGAINAIESRFETSIEEIATRLQMSAGKVKRIFTKGGMPAFNLIDQFMGTVVPESVMQKKVRTFDVQSQKIKDTFRSFYVKSTERGSFEGIITDLERINKLFQDLLDSPDIMEKFGKGFDQFIDKIRQKGVGILTYLFEGTSVGKTFEENLKLVAGRLVSLLGMIISQAIMAGLKAALPFIKAIAVGMAAELKPGGRTFDEAFAASFADPGAIEDISKKHKKLSWLNKLMPAPGVGLSAMLDPRLNLQKRTLDLYAHAFTLKGTPEEKMEKLRSYAGKLDKRLVNEEYLMDIINNLNRSPLSNPPATIDEFLKRQNIFSDLQSMSKGKKIMPAGAGGDIKANTKIIIPLEIVDKSGKKLHEQTISIFARQILPLYET